MSERLDKLLDHNAALEKENKSMQERVNTEYELRRKAEDENIKLKAELADWKDDCESNT